MEASETGTTDPEGTQSEGGVQTTTTTETKPLTEGEGQPDPAANPQPIDQGSTAQEQAQGESSAGEQPPAEPGAPVPEAQFEQEQTAAAAAQSPAETQTVPEQRPQAFTGAESVSESSKRLDGAPAATEEDYERANSDEAKKASIENSRTPNLIVGQRVQIIEPNKEAGRMAYVLQVIPADGIQGMLMNSGTPEARFAEVQSYVVRTRDGRSDTLDVPPAELKPLEVDQGWGRGQI